MAFVSEEITKKEDEEYFNGFGFKNILGDLVEPCWWAIDREKISFYSHVEEERLKYQ